MRLSITGGTASGPAAAWEQPTGLYRTATAARLAGAVGVVANAILLGFFATYPVGSAADGVQRLLGPASDLTGSLFGALLIPVAAAVGRELPRTRAVRVRQTLAMLAMAALTAGGVLLRMRLASFEVATALSVAGTLGVAAWIALTARGLALTGIISARTATLGRVLSGGELAGFAVAAAGLALPSRSVAQFAVLAVGLVPSFVCWLAIPAWFLLFRRRTPTPDPRNGREDAEAR